VQRSKVRHHQQVIAASVAMNSDLRLSQRGLALHGLTIRHPNSHWLLKRHRAHVVPLHESGCNKVRCRAAINQKSVRRAFIH
jgi:hypothetical protein